MRNVRNLKKEKRNIHNVTNERFQETIIIWLFQHIRHILRLSSQFESLKFAQLFILSLNHRLYIDPPFLLNWFIFARTLFSRLFHRLLFDCSLGNKTARVFRTSDRAHIVRGLPRFNNPPSCALLTRPRVPRHFFHYRLTGRKFIRRRTFLPLSWVRYHYVLGIWVAHTTRVTS